MGNLGNSAGRVFTCLVVTHANILASVRSTVPRDTASQLNRTLFYYSCDPKITRIHCFGYMLRPVNFRRTTPRPVSCYAFFKGWLLLSQPPGCRSNRTSFATEHVLGTLTNDLGCCPHDDGNSLSPSHSRSQKIGIRSLSGFGSSRRTPHPNSISTPDRALRGCP